MKNIIAPIIYIITSNKSKNSKNYNTINDINSG